MSKTLTVKICLSKIGNQLPHFSITAEEREDHRLVACGPMHEEILLAHPELADIVALHLSDINGVPMHAVENGWYWLSSSLGGLGEKYFHANKEEAFDFFCKHCRISVEDGRKIWIDSIRFYDNATEKPVNAKPLWVGICDSMKPRWKKEAETAIKKYQLKVEVVS